MKKSSDNIVKNQAQRLGKSVDGLVGVARTGSIGGVINSSNKGVGHGSFGVNKKTIQPKAPPGVRVTKIGGGPLQRQPQRPVATVGQPRVTAQEVIRRKDKDDLDSSLNAIDLQESKAAKKHDSKRKARRRKIIKRVVLAIVILAVLVFGYVAVKAFIASNKTFQGGFIGFIQKTSLKQDANGRSNILVFGTSEDSEGGNHPGGNLTDSIMLLTIDQNKKDAFMISLPRDFWVKLDQPCSVGYEEKLNTVYMCASDDGKYEQNGADALRKKVGEILGMDIQYYAHLNYKVVADAVDAVDGVQVTIETDDPRGIYDPNFDWMCKHQCKMVNYKQGETVTLDGAHALALARARNAQGGYGLPGGNFDRERNQQKILRALQDKALSAGTLTNLGKVTGLIDALGNNLRTNVNTSEIRTILDLAQEIKGEKLQSIALDEEGSAVVTTGNHLGRSVVMPVAGVYNYSGIQALITKKINGSAAGASEESDKQENATVSVYNGSGIAGLAKKSSDELKAKGLTIGDVGNAPGGARQQTVIYQTSNNMPKTKALLEAHYGVSVTTGQSPVAGNGANFVIILGTSAQ